MHYNNTSISQAIKETVAVKKKIGETEILDDGIISDEEWEVCFSFSRRIISLEREYDETGEESLLKEIEKLKEERRIATPRIESKMKREAEETDYIRIAESPYPDSWQ
jgi:hypothetical protein